MPLSVRTTLSLMLLRAKQVLDSTEWNTIKRLLYFSLIFYIASRKCIEMSNLSKWGTGKNSYPPVRQGTTVHMSISEIKTEDKRRYSPSRTIKWVPAQVHKEIYKAHERGLNKSAWWNPMDGPRSYFLSYHSARRRILWPFKAAVDVYQPL